MSRAGEIQVHCEVIQHAEDSSAKVLNVRVWTEDGTWNNGKSGARLDLTSSITPGLQIHTVDPIQTANMCDWLTCRRAALLLVG